FFHPHKGADRRESVRRGGKRLPRHGASVTSLVGPPRRRAAGGWADVRQRIEDALLEELGADGFPLRVIAGDDDTLAVRGEVGSLDLIRRASEVIDRNRGSAAPRSPVWAACWRWAPLGPAAELTACLRDDGHHRRGTSLHSPSLATNSVDQTPESGCTHCGRAGPTGRALPVPWPRAEGPCSGRPFAPPSYGTLLRRASRISSW